MGTQQFLVLPMRIDAMAVEEERWVQGPTADFSRLPYVYGQPQLEGFRGKARPDVPIDVSAETAPISENIVTQPFSSRNFPLSSGLHLHWALPSGLTKGNHPSRHGTP